MAIDVQWILDNPILPALLMTALFVYVALKFGMEKTSGNNQ